MTDRVVDLLVVGSGAAGSTAAIAAADAGLSVLVVESTELVGGSSGLSGGGLWIPTNSVTAEAGIVDDYATARGYLDRVIGDVGPASSAERRHAFLTEGPAMVDLLRRRGVELIHSRGYADYYPELPGGNADGRGIECSRWDLRRLGPWRKKIRGEIPVPAHTFEVNQIYVAGRSLRAFGTTMSVILRHGLGGLVRGKHLVGMGRSLMGQLLHQLLGLGVEIWLRSPLVELTVLDGAVTGAIVDRDGQPVSVTARRGVVLAAGGFARSGAMRRQYQEAPITDEWSSAAPGDLGTGIRAGAEAGAALALMDDAWWGPTVTTPRGPVFLLGERALPHGFIVDASGQRFMNEAESYVDAGHHIYQRNSTVRSIPAYLVIDSRHRRRYPLAGAPPGMTPPSYRRSGMVTKARTLRELADKVGIDPDGLAATAARFEEFARSGKDQDFGRGDSAYDRVYSDPSTKPNPNLGAVSRPPFYAVEIWPGDLGTKGGLLTDEHARVLREDGSVITGLYAAGNCSASVMGRTYPGPGATLGPAMTFGYVAGRHAAKFPDATGTTA